MGTGGFVGVSTCNRGVVAVLLTCKVKRQELKTIQTTCIDGENFGEIGMEPAFLYDGNN
jgi:hypothetical protein